MKLNPLFSDHLVLQANQPIRIFGEGYGKATVTVDGLSGHTETVGSHWLVELPAHPYGGPYEVTVDLNGVTTVLTDVYFGDVFLLAGQSNLQFKMRTTTTPPEAYQSNPKLRLFSSRRPEESESFFPEDGWVVAEKETVEAWSAVGYLAGNNYVQRTGHAVGLITCYQGASMIQSWLPAGVLLGTECDIAAEERSGHQRRQQYMAWNHDGQLYKEIFLKLVPFSMKAVVWYQGESNTHPPENTTEIYCGMLTRLIHCWRADLKNPTLPFVIIQLADYIHGNPEGWKAVQQAQLDITKVLEQVYSVISADVCESDGIHPPTKLPLAERLSDVWMKL